MLRKWVESLVNNFKKKIKIKRWFSDFRDPSEVKNDFKWRFRLVKLVFFRKGRK